MDCAHCGHELGIGRFCTNCGQPIPGRHEGVPASAAPPPAAPRYPLYADTPPDAPPVAPFPVVVPTVPVAPRRPADRQRPGPRWVLWAIVGLVLVVALVVVLVVLLGGGDDESADDPTHRAAQTAGARSPGSTGDTGTDGTSSPAGGAPGPAADLASAVARIRVPGTAPDSTDARTGAPVTFGAAHLTDGDTTTCWRVEGDASGGTLTITFSSPVTLTEVGLVNGYAKSYPGYDGYRLNRKVLAVRWVLDDGTEVDQQLAVDRRMQTVPVDFGATTTLRLEIERVSPPGPGPFGKDFTAISELHLLGTPA